MVSLKYRPHQLESRMPEMGQSGSEGGVALTTPSLPLSHLANNTEHGDLTPLWNGIAHSGDEFYRSGNYRIECNQK